MQLHVQYLQDSIMDPLRTVQPEDCAQNIVGMAVLFLYIRIMELWMPV